MKAKSARPSGQQVGPQVIRKVCVRWWDGYYEDFLCEEVRFGGDLLWLRLATVNQENRHIPLRQVRWYSVTPESHECNGG